MVAVFPFKNALSASTKKSKFVSYQKQSGMEHGDFTSAFIRKAFICNFMYFYLKKIKNRIFVISN